MEKNKKLIVLGVLALILIISGITYAILTWTSSKINIGLTSGCFTIDYTKGQDISGNLKLLNESDLISNNKFTIKNGIGISAVNIGIKSTCTIEGYGSIYLNVTNISETFTTGDSKGALKYAVLSNTSTITTPSSVTVDSLLNQSFDIVSTGSITSSDTITLLTKQLSNTEIYKYLVVIYVDNALAGNSITSATFTGNISADAEQGKYVEPTPEYCFNITDKDETNKTASLSSVGYNCYEGNSNGYKVVNDIVIPDTIAGYKITKIKEGFACAEYSYSSMIGYNICRQSTNISSVIMPNTILSIGKQSFTSNNLVSVTLSNSLTTIDSYAFAYNKLTDVIIPASVIDIGYGAFMNNNLDYVLIDYGSNLSSISGDAFTTSNETGSSFAGVEYIENPNLKIIYNNSGKAFDWNKAVNGSSGTAFVTGTTNAKTIGSTTYNAVTVTTGQPS